ncbi:MAG: septum formation initiator family protein [Desulfamplus sp.]|nr:septum formation initiator family protein [Desulfamplus sp.]
MNILDKTLFWTAVIALSALAFLIIYGKNGYIDQQRLYSEEHLIISENMAIQEENRKLERKIERLKSDLSYIEHIARHELGMMAEDELVFRFQDIKQ